MVGAERLGASSAAAHHFGVYSFEHRGEVALRGGIGLAAQRDGKERKSHLGPIRTAVGALGRCGVTGVYRTQELQCQPLIGRTRTIVPETRPTCDGYCHDEQLHGPPLKVRAPGPIVPPPDWRSPQAPSLLNVAFAWVAVPGIITCAVHDWLFAASQNVSE